MYRASLSVVLLVGVSLFTPNLSSAAPGKRYVVVLPGNQLPFEFAASVLGAKGQIVRTFPRLGVAVTVSSSPDFISSLSRKLGFSPESISPVPISQVPTVTRRNASGPRAADSSYNMGAQWSIQRVHADQAWKAGFTGSHRTVVAVIDTGIAWNHPDLRTNVVLKKCFTSESTCNPYPSWSDHGTHVAGIIAAAFAGGSVVGVGPNLGLASYNVFEQVPDCGVCSYEDSRWAAMMDAADYGVSVINLSQGTTYVLGGQGSNQIAAFRAAEKKVVDYVTNAGVLVIASAGNGNANLSGPIMHLPGDTAGVVNVGATAIRPNPRYPSAGAYDVRAYYSNYGAPVTVSAPGGDCGVDTDCDLAVENWFEYHILSTAVFPDPFCAETADCPVDYDWKAGTSMAAAHVSGVAGLVRDASGQLKPQAVSALLKNTADSAGARLQFGHGIVNAFEAVLKARAK
jgi:subtilisin family serine protease